MENRIPRRKKGMSGVGRRGNCTRGNVWIMTNHKDCALQNLCTTRN